MIYSSLYDLWQTPLTIETKISPDRTFSVLEQHEKSDAKVNSRTDCKHYGQKQELVVYHLPQKADWRTCGFGCFH
jgi:hypothetical protein